jgi:outer membrane lipoprotein carrier protein
MIFIFSVCIVFSQAYGKTETVTLKKVLAGLEARYSGKSFEASFSQVSRLDALDVVEKASGRAFFAYPGRMKWEYFTPDHHEIITNGKKVWIFRPDENQVMRGSARSFFREGAGGAFLSDITMIRAHYDTHIKSVSSSWIDVTLVPRVSTDQIAFISVRMARPGFEIIKVTTVNAYGDTTMFEFHDIRFRKIAPEIFEFSIPSGTNVINMN